VSRAPDPTIIPHNFGSVRLDQIASVVVNPSMNLKLISREIIFEVFPFPTYVILIHQRHRQTDMQSQDLALHCSASRGKNRRNCCCTALYRYNCPSPLQPYRIPVSAP